MANNHLDNDSRNENLWNKMEQEKPNSSYRDILELRKQPKKTKEYRSTLDIDKNDKKFIDKIIQKIRLCKNNISLEVKDSSLKGVHITLYCSKNCDICRIVYDDFRRLAYDSNRPYYARNILFATKEKL